MIKLLKQWTHDDDTKIKSLFTVLKQSRTIKHRLFSLVQSGQFDVIHNKLCKLTKHFMSYSWMEYNTILFLLFKVDKMYRGCQEFVYVVDYCMSIGAPEAFCEGMFSDLKAIMSGNVTMDIGHINDKYRLRSHCRNEFSESTDSLLKNATMTYLANNRAPITTARSNKKIGTVLDRIFKKVDLTVDVSFGYNDDDSDEYSESDDDVLLDMHIDLQELNVNEIDINDSD